MVEKAVSKTTNFLKRNLPYWRLPWWRRIHMQKITLMVMKI